MKLQQLGILRSRFIYYGKPFNLRKLLRFYAQFIRPGDLCFDLGAHVGNRVEAWTKLGAKVVAVEPQPACLAFLKKRFSKNPLVVFVPQAVGAEKGKALFHLSGLTPTVSTLAGEIWRQSLNENAFFKSRWQRQTMVDVTTLDALIETYGQPAFCKIDVEGFEAQVLQGLSAPLPSLSFEFFAWTPEVTLQCVHLLENLEGYEYNWGIRENHRLQFQNWLTPPELEKALRKIAHASFSGDIYARIRT